MTMQNKNFTLRLSMTKDQAFVDFDSRKQSSRQRANGVPVPPRQDSHGPDHGYHKSDRAALADEIL